MAQPIVDGVKGKFGDQINFVQLNLLSLTGRQASRAFGVSMVPATILFNGRGDIVLRKIGMPDGKRLTDCLNGQLDFSGGPARAAETL